MSTYVQLIGKAHTHMDAALDPRMADMAVFNARHAMIYAQSAMQRSNASWERAECADLVREATAVLR